MLITSDVETSAGSPDVLFIASTSKHVDHTTSVIGWERIFDDITCDVLSTICIFKSNLVKQVGKLRGSLLTLSTIS